MEDRLKWYAVYQLSNRLIGLLKDTSDDKLIEVFDLHAGELGDAIEQLEAAGRVAFEEADKYQLRVSADEFLLFSHRKQQ